MVVFAGTKVVKKSIHAANGRKKRAQVRMIVYGRQIVTRRRARSRLRSVEDARFSAAGRSLRTRRPAVLANMRALRRLRPKARSHRVAGLDIADVGGPQLCRAKARSSRAARCVRFASCAPNDDACGSTAACSRTPGEGPVSTSIDPAGFGPSKYVM